MEGQLHFGAHNGTSLGFSNRECFFCSLCALGTVSSKAGLSHAVSSQYNFEPWWRRHCRLWKAHWSFWQPHCGLWVRGPKAPDPVVLPFPAIVSQELGLVVPDSVIRAPDFARTRHRRPCCHGTSVYIYSKTRVLLKPVLLSRC